MSYPRVKDLLIAYDSGGMVSVIRYLNDDNLIIDPSTFIGKMKNLLDTNKVASMEAEIASLIHTFKLDINNARSSYNRYKYKRSEDGGDSSDTSGRSNGEN